MWVFFVVGDVFCCIIGRFWSTSYLHFVRLIFKIFNNLNWTLNKTLKEFLNLVDMTLIQYVIVRGDLMKVLKWNIGNSKFNSEYNPRIKFLILVLLNWLFIQRCCNYSMLSCSSSYQSFDKRWWINEKLSIWTEFKFYAQMCFTGKFID